MSGTIEDMIKSLIDGGLMTADDVASFNASLSDRERPISPDSYGAVRGDHAFEAQGRGLGSSDREAPP